jgi:hypothetical protein
MNDDKPLSADDLIKIGIRDRAEEEGLFAVAYAITKLNDTFGAYVSNLAIQHANETYTAKATADALAVLARGVSVVAGTYANVPQAYKDPLIRL